MCTYRLHNADCCMQGRPPPHATFFDVVAGVSERHVPPYRDARIRAPSNSVGSYKNSRLQGANVREWQFGQSSVNTCMVESSNPGCPIKCDNPWYEFILVMHEQFWDLAVCSYSACVVVQYCFRQWWSCHNYLEQTVVFACWNSFMHKFILAWWRSYLMNISLVSKLLYAYG